MHHLQAGPRSAGLAVSGPASGAPVVVVVGRSNYRQPSHLIARLAADLARRGVAVLVFETRDERTGRFLDARLGSGPFGLNAPGLTGAAGLARKLMRSAVVLAHPAHWGYFVSLLGGRRRMAMRDLRAFARALGVPHVILLGHSAGSIIAAGIEDEPAVDGQISFGHPFRHPERGEEPWRTAPLATRRKPLLIIQGLRDRYGDAAAAARYPLSASVRLVSLDAAHEYGDIAEGDYASVLALATDFLGLAPEAAKAPVLAAG